MTHVASCCCKNMLNGLNSINAGSLMVRFEGTQTPAGTDTQAITRASDTAKALVCMQLDQ